MMKKLKKQFKASLNTIHAYDCGTCLGTSYCLNSCTEVGNYTYRKYVYSYQWKASGGK